MGHPFGVRRVRTALVSTLIRDNCASSYKVLSLTKPCPQLVAWRPKKENLRSLLGRGRMELGFSGDKNSALKFETQLCVSICCF